MRPSRLYGTLEAPGQKSYPSKTVDYGINNPEPGQIATPAMTFLRKLPNGQVWKQYDTNLPKENIDGPEQERHAPGKMPKMTVSGIDGLTTYGILPTYPDIEAVREALTNPPPPRKIEYVEAPETFPFAPPKIELGKGLTSKFSVSKIEQLKSLGFTEQMINDAIQDEMKKDIRAVIDNPSMFREAEVAAQIERTWEQYRISQQPNSGESGAGLASGSGVQNAGVRSYSAAAAAAQRAEFAAPSVERGRMIAARVAQLETIKRPPPAADEDYQSLSLSAAAAAASSYGVAGGIGAGPGGVVPLLPFAVPQLSLSLKPTAAADEEEPRGAAGPSMADALNQMYARASDASSVATREPRVFGGAPSKAERQALAEEGYRSKAQKTAVLRMIEKGMSESAARFKFDADERKKAQKKQSKK
jgi:hypothetical protein